MIVIFVLSVTYPNFAFCTIVMFHVIDMLNLYKGKVLTNPSFYLINSKRNLGESGEFRFKISKITN